MKRKLIAFIGLFLILSAGGIVLGFAIVIASPDGPRRFSAWWVGGDFAGTDGVVLQDKRNNCGPAALQMAFDHFGIASTVKEIEEGVGMTERGSSMLALKEMAEQKGLRAEGWRLTMEDLLAAPKPCIVFINGDHFALVDSVSKVGEIFLRDPAVGKLNFAKNKFTPLWRGETLVLRKGSDQANSGNIQ